MRKRLVFGMRSIPSRVTWAKDRIPGDHGGGAVDCRGRSGTTLRAIIDHGNPRPEPRPRASGGITRARHGDRPRDTTRISGPRWMSRTLGLLQIILCIGTDFGPTGCALPVSRAPAISRYQAAACVPLSSNPTVVPRTREWDSEIPLPEGLKVVIHGAQLPGGRITAFYPATGRELVVADAGDYVYPSDVRIDTHNGILYVKAHGLAGGISEQTWLFEYDLRRQYLLSRLEVKNGTLSSECPSR